MSERVAITRISVELNDGSWLELEPEPCLGLPAGAEMQIDCSQPIPDISGSRIPFQFWPSPELTFTIRGRAERIMHHLRVSERCVACGRPF